MENQSPPFGPLFYELLHYTLPRYLRISTSNAIDRDTSTSNHHANIITEVIEKLNARLGLTCIHQIQWMPSYIIVPGYLPIRTIYEALSDMDHLITIFPMDIASAIPSHILSQYQPQTSLDLCCSPGGKLLTLMDYSRLSPWGHQCAIGVDISNKRLQICQSILHSYLTSQYRIDQNAVHYIPRVMLFCADGTTFSATNLGQLVYDTHVDLEEIISSAQTGRKRQNKSSRGRTKKRLRSIQSSLEGTIVEVDEEENFSREKGGNHMTIMNEYDVVLVDAQCTHDGSYRHLRYGQADTIDDDSKDDLTLSSPSWIASSDIPQSYVTKSIKREVYELETLQRGLILNGFKRLKRGGTMIYSTCSHEKSQNENIVTWLIDTTTAQNIGTAVLIPLSEWTCPTPNLTPPRHEHPSSTAILPFLLSSSDEILYSYLSEISSSSSQSLKDLSHDICRYIGTLLSPMGRAAEDLPETLYFGRWGGTSGLYIACIQKR